MKWRQYYKEKSQQHSQHAYDHPDEVSFSFLYPWVDTRSRNWCCKLTQFFRRRFLVRVSCKSGTGFVWYQILVPIRTQFYSKPENGVHAAKKHCTKVHNKHRTFIMHSNICSEYKITFMHLLSASEIFIPNTHGVKKTQVGYISAVWGADPVELIIFVQKLVKL